MKPQFIQKNLQTLDKLVKASSGITVVAGFVDKGSDGLYNAAAVVHNGKHVGTYRKIMLPNYGVFDEDRYFKPGRECTVYTIGGIGVGVSICEDIWFEDGPPLAQSRAGAELILNISASPYHYGKVNQRVEMLKSRAQEYTAIVAYCNLVGGQDELVFDGSSLLLDENGRVMARGERFAEDLVVADIDVSPVSSLRCDNQKQQQPELHNDLLVWNTARVNVSGPVTDLPKPSLPSREVKEMGLEEEIYRALVLGTRDYMSKNGFKKVTLGLSGGVDSPLWLPLPPMRWAKRTSSGFPCLRAIHHPAASMMRRNWRRTWV
jgi:NAD+ synthase (glutamine-hydrolysing)